jgi:hypothetical protein
MQDPVTTLDEIMDHYKTNKEDVEHHIIEVESEEVVEEPQKTEMVNTICSYKKSILSGSYCLSTR